MPQMAPNLWLPMLITLTVMMLFLLAYLSFCSKIKINSNKITSLDTTKFYWKW
uniref:ATP synthase F0 subunit 8 n=1 Tax=Pseudoniphargus sp. 1-Basque TaxID=2212664 RepID=A0A345UE44_9CRUS|nr:ATP synthase F0 subunit 8 [Pseudoniphargus sp. 1-Basque]